MGHARGPDPEIAVSDAPPTLLDDPIVTAAIRDHDAAEVAVVEARHALARAREAVRNALFDAGQPYRDRDLPLPRADIHRLYWEHRELRLTDLANALGISTAELARLAGPTEGHGRCGDCQQLVPMLLDTRTTKPDHEPRMRCEPCRARHDAYLERERRRQHEVELAHIAAGDTDRDPMHPLERSPYGGLPS